MKVQIFIDHRLPDVILLLGWDPIVSLKSSVLPIHPSSIVRGLSPLLPAANQTARPYYTIHLWGLRDSFPVQL
ncbi:MAG: hypothetical protein F4183_07445 [Rhodothermaceae bacterium]|nr:hypothetical protein [Rhodothermaceae bacterium]